MTAPSLKSLAFAGRLVRVWRDTDGKLWFVAEDVADALSCTRPLPAGIRAEKARCRPERSLANICRNAAAVSAPTVPCMMTSV